jgi:hypothetical protein
MGRAKKGKGKVAFFAYSYWEELLMECADG